MIGVIGATGNVGSALLVELARLGERVVAVSAEGGVDGPAVRHVRADVTAPATIEDALRGSSAVFLLVPTEVHDDVDPDAVVRAVERAGAARIVVLSSMGTVSRPHAPGYEGLRHLEDAARRSSRAVTILRPTGFATNTLAWAHGVRASQRIEAPFGDVAIPVVDPADVAAVAARALRDEGHEGAAYDLTGPEPITPRGQARALADALGVPIDFVELSREDAARLMRAHMPPSIVEATLDISGTPNALERRVSPDVERVLGRPATPYAEWARRNVAAFR